jgi:hypothetical protein
MLSGVKAIFTMFTTWRLVYIRYKIDTYTVEMEEKSAIEVYICGASMVL